MFDDHIWMTVLGEGWAIKSIIRDRDRSMKFINLWRGYSPNLQYISIAVSGVDWSGYCKAAVAMMKEQEDAH